MTDGELLLAAMLSAGFGSLQPEPWWKAVPWFALAVWCIILLAMQS